MVDKLLPYNVSISRTLDTAEDLMIATTGILLDSGKEEVKPKEPTSPIVTGTTEAKVYEWLEKNLSNLFGPSVVRMPSPIFLSKIADELNLYGVSLDKLGTILKDSSLKSKYRDILEASNVSYIPVYQQTLCFILLALGNDVKSVIERVNQELILLGIKLREPEPQKA